MRELNYDENWTPEIKKVHAEHKQFSSRHFAPNVYSWYGARTRMVVELIKKHAPMARTVLDIGCAQGTIAITLAELGYDVIGNDIREFYTEYAKMRDDKSCTKFVCSNFMEFNPPHRFDVIVLTEVIEHIVEHDKFLRKIHDCLVPGGVFLVTTPNHGYFRENLPSFSEISMIDNLDKQFSADGSDHFYLFRKDELVSLLGKNKFRLLEHRYFLSFIQYGFLKSGLLWRIFPMSIMEKISNMFTRYRTLCAQQCIVVRADTE